MGQMKDRSGRKQPTYRFENNQIEILPYFLYEVSLDKLWEGGSCCLKSRLFKSSKFLKVKDTEVKHYNGYNIVRSITLMGAPYGFIKEHNLPIYKLHSKNHKNEKLH